MRSRLERLIGDLDLVSREEFDAMKALAQAARAENEQLAHRWTRPKASLARAGRGLRAGLCAMHARRGDRGGAPRG